jgi:hypothetical protein
MLPSLNLCAVIIHFKDAYLKWAEDLDGDRPDNNDGNIYLIDESETGSREEVRGLLLVYWRDIADEEFDSWCTDPELWPKLKDIGDFEKFFKWDFREVVCDLLDEPLVSDGEDESEDGFIAGLN